MISGSSAFSKTSLNIRTFTVHVLLKPGLENFEHYFTSYPVSEVRGGGREDQPHIQGAVAERAQEGLEELSYIESQEGWR